jgi:hypothetical protein
LSRYFCRAPNDSRAPTPRKQTRAQWTAATLKVLYSAESEVVGLLLSNAPADVKNGVTPVYAVADDTQIPHPAWVECRTDNNTSQPVKASCDQPQ